MTLTAGIPAPRLPPEAAQQPLLRPAPVSSMVDALFRRRRAIVCGALLGLLGATAAMLLIPQRWQAFADIELAPSPLASDGSRQDAAASLSDAAIENQGVMALSHPVLQRASHILSQSGAAAADSNDAITLRQILTVRRLPRTRVWRISASGSSPTAAAQIANSVATAWTLEHGRLQTDTAVRLTQRIRARLPALEQQLRVSENAAALWRRRHALVADGSASGASLAERHLTTLNERLANARADTIGARAQLERFVAAKPGDAQEDASPAMQGLRQQMTDLARRDAELATRYGAQYPERAAMRAQIGATSRAIAAERLQRLNTLRAGADTAAAREAALRKSLDSTGTEDAAPQGGASDNAIRLRELERQAAADRHAYETSLGRLRSSEEVLHLAEPEARIMSPAIADTNQRAMAPGVALALAGLAGAIAGFGAAALRDRMRDTCLSAQQVADDLGLIRVAEAPLLRRDLLKARGHIMQPATVVAMRPLSRFAEGFRTVRNTLETHPCPRPSPRSGAALSLALPDDPRGNIVVVTSGQPGDGKTTTAIGLALSLADAGHRVALVDADLRRAGLSDFFDLRTHVGLAEMLRDQASFASASVRRANLLIIPSGSIAGAGARPLSLVDAPTGQLLRRISAAFDHVIVDGPPIDVTEDAEILVRAADTAVLAVRWGHTPRCRAKSMAARLAAQGKLGAVMLTRIDLSRTPRYGRQASYSNSALREYFRG